MSLQFSLAFQFVIQVALVFLQHSSEGTVFNNCVNSTSANNLCSDITYEQVYNSLTKSENSFNIEASLYPAKKPSSVRVFVNVYGPNKTAAKYTWSISCLYTALPVEVLEVWSLGAILVTRRTQKLDLTILILCCDVTQGKLKGHIDGVLAALQDLAVKPSLRDPEQNNAECVTEGHKPDINATGQSDRIIAILCCSFLFSILSGPLLASYVMQYKKTQLEKHRESRTINIFRCVSLDKQKECRTIDILCGALLVIFLCLFIYCIVLASQFRNFIPAIYPLIAVLGFVVGVCIHCSLTIEINNEQVKWYVMPCFVTCASLTAYHFCWLLIGIMLNPTWGLAVLLVVCLVIGVFTYMVFMYLCSVKHDCQPFFSCLAALLAVCFLIVVMILAGQSYHGRETADEVLKDAVLYLIPAFFSWLYWKHIHASKNSSPTSSGFRLLTSNTTMKDAQT